MNSDGAKTPPEPPIAIVRLVARIFAGQEQEQEPDDVAAADRMLERRVADAVQLRQGKEQEPEQQAAGRRAKPFRPSRPETVGEVLGAVEDADEDDAR